ncbi:hypothetical protein GC096_04195 [Paenibacillus sp. LMG 31461]|uniref:Uncharacterized protein n=1 Tax=Paenibacillus plantarum TaxID=2654975 RepID=A0ABX1X595_9BACL|nr:hypothetical protein [Paenibacillus plantarum]NOU63244.1 hypothetical protein [Paenibacillus plantarum]
MTEMNQSQTPMEYGSARSVVNEAREKLEGITDTLHAPVMGQAKKPRTYRKKALLAMPIWPFPNRVARESSETQSGRSTTALCETKSTNQETIVNRAHPKTVS